MLKNDLHRGRAPISEMKSMFIGRQIPHAAWLFLLLVSVALCGCGGGSEKKEPKAKKKEAARSEVQEVAFESAISMFTNIEDFDPRMAGELIRRGLNEWLSAQRPDEDWTADPLIEGLPEELTDLDDIFELNSMQFPIRDSSDLRVIAWLSRIARELQDDNLSAVEQADRLFDWVVRNMALDKKLPNKNDKGLTNVPIAVEVALTLGHGDYEVRGWVFMLLARQLNLPIVFLGIKDEKADQGYRTWSTALLHNNELYCFDPELGLPIFGPDGTSAATLSQLASDDGLLRALDLADKKYPVKAADLQEVAAFVEASPIYVSRRMQMVSSRISGKQNLVLTTQPTALADDLLKIPHVSKVDLWHRPLQPLRIFENATSPITREEFLAFFMPSNEDPDGSRTPTYLTIGRSMHLMRKFTGDQNTLQYYQLARPSKSDIDDQAGELMAKAFERQKEIASCWLGIIAFERKQYSVAVDYFQKRTLDAFPKGGMRHPAKYNLGRTYEALGDVDRAIELYEEDDKSPQYHGNAIRAKRLRAKQQKAPGTDEKKS